MKEQLWDWFEYNYMANLKLINRLEELEEIPEKAVDILRHILLAHRIWLNRLRSLKNSADKPWGSIDPQLFSEINSENYQQTLEILKSVNQAALTKYSNTLGKQFTNTNTEKFFHILTHSSYHRGQLALLIRITGEDPPNTDYIFFKR